MANGDPRETYENESQDESKLDNWYGNPDKNANMFVSTIICIAIIASMFGLYFAVRG